MTDAPRFVVRCEAWESNPFRTEQEAERRRAAIVAAGNCPLQHNVIDIAAEAANGKEQGK